MRGRLRRGRGAVGRGASRWRPPDETGGSARIASRFGQRARTGRRRGAWLPERRRGEADRRSPVGEILDGKTHFHVRRPTAILPRIEEEEDEARDCGRDRVPIPVGSRRPIRLRASLRRRATASREDVPGRRPSRHRRGDLFGETADLPRKAWDPRAASWLRPWSRSGDRLILAVVSLV